MPASFFWVGGTRGGALVARWPRQLTPPRQLARHSLPPPLRNAEFLMRGCLRVVQWNADGLKLKVQELEAFLDQHRVDVCMVQETKLREVDRTPSFGNYIALRRDRRVGPSGPRSGGGLLTLIKKDVPYREVFPTRDTRGSNLEVLAVEVPTGRCDRLTLVNVYLPPIRTTPGETRADVFDPEILPMGCRFLICGDLNAHSHLWDRSQPADARGVFWNSGSWTMT